jgi:hypothetical protein
MRETKVTGGPAARRGPGTRLRPGQPEAVVSVRPHAVWRGLSPAAQARVRHAFLRVLHEALGAAGAVLEGSRDAPGR